MNKFKKISVVTLIGIGASGCMSTYEPSPYVNQVNKSAIVSATAALSHTIIQPKNSDNFTCLSPQPDADFSQSGSDGFNFSGAGTTDGIFDSESSGGNEMNGRTPGILFSRDMMYRLCEFTLNYNLTKQEAIALYKQNITALNALMLEESKKTTVTISDSLADTYKTHDTVNDKNSASLAATKKTTTATTQPANASTGGIAVSSTANSYSDANYAPSSGE